MIGPATSLYLDVTRVVACFFVVCTHVHQLTDYAPLEIPSKFGRIGVMVFFVISGAVIANSTIMGRKRWREYAAARAARIYAVSAPAIWLSFAISLAFPGIHPSQAYTTVQTYLLAHVFYTQSWSFFLPVPLNAPFWSLCYEVWYYVAFGLFLFAPRGLRWTSATAAMVIAGPAIILLLPVWLLGVLIALVPLRIPSATIAFWVSGAVIVALGVVDMRPWVVEVLKAAFPQIWFVGFAQSFPFDYLVGAATAVHFVAFAQARPAHLVALLDRCRGAIAASAQRTYSVYLFHMPLLILMRHLGPGAHPLLLLAGTIAASAALAEITEAQAPRLRAALAPRRVGRSSRAA